MIFEQVYNKLVIKNRYRFYYTFTNSSNKRIRVEVGLDKIVAYLIIEGKNGPTWFNIFNSNEFDLNCDTYQDKFITDRAFYICMKHVYKTCK